MVGFDPRTCLAIPGAIWATIQISGKVREWGQGHAKFRRWIWILAALSIVVGLIFGVQFHRSGPGEGEGKLTVVENEGSIADAIIDKLKITGSPAPNTDTKIIDNRGKIGKLSIMGGEVDCLSDAPIPPPDHPVGASSLSYKARVSRLAEATAQWYGQNIDKGPSLQQIDAYQTYWTPKMSEFHDGLGNQTMLLMQEMRNCQYPNVKSIYWREEHRSTLPAILVWQVRDLRALRDRLPDEDSQLPCVQSP